MKIGIYIPNWVGDAVMALPFLARCRQYFENDSILAIAREWVSPILESTSLVDEIFTIGKLEGKGISGTTLTGRRLKLYELDKVFLLSSSWRSAYLAWVSGARERIGYSGQFRSSLLTVSHPEVQEKIHRSARYLNLIGTELYNDYSTTIRLTENEVDIAGKYIQSLGFNAPLLIFPGSVAFSRRPPASLWSRIIKFALKYHYDIIVMGGKKDILLADEVISEFKEQSVKSLCGEMTLRESIAIISICSGAIATDSGLAHIAANLGLPTVSLFGAGDPDVTAPIGKKTDIIFQNVHCSPCKKNWCRNNDEPLLCLTEMSPERIWNRYCRLVEKG